MKKGDILFRTFIVIIFAGSIVMFFWARSIIACVNISCFSLLAFQAGVNRNNQSHIKGSKEKAHISELLAVIVFFTGLIFSFQTFVWVTIADLINPRMKVPGVLAIFSFCFFTPALIGEWARKFDWVRNFFIYSPAYEQPEENSLI